jgi:hypothetical protein
MAESLALGSPASALGKRSALPALDQPHGEREGVTLPEAIRRLSASVWRRADP